MRFLIVFISVFFVSLSSIALEKENMIITEHYFHDSLGSIGMFGHAFNTFMTPSMYYSLSLFEAIYGQDRSGYAVANLGLGYRMTTSFARIDPAVYIGAGGGGHLSEHVAGGLSIKFQSGVLFDTPYFFTPVIYIGYMTYPYGDFNSFFVSGGINYPFKITTKTPVTASKVFRSSWEMNYKQYIYDNATEESISLLGGERKKYFYKQWYYGESGYAAFSSGRFGYIEVGLFAGKRIDLNPFVLHFNLNIGAGGGGGSSYNEGTGFLIQPLFQVGLPIASDYEFNLDFRHVNFLSGDINSYSTGFSIRYLFEQF